MRLHSDEDDIFNDIKDSLLPAVGRILKEKALITEEEKKKLKEEKSRELVPEHVQAAKRIKKIQDLSSKRTSIIN